MKKKFALYLLGILLAFSLTACAGKSEAPSETDAENTPEETVTEEIPVETAEDTDNTDDSAAKEEEPKELEIVDCVPEGPADADFGPDNIGFYMEGEEFTLPMPYNEFLAKAESLGYSVDEDTIYFTIAEGIPNCKYGKITFERPVENQNVDLPETFDIKVINSVDYSKDIDLTDPDVHVVTFYMHMFGSYRWEEVDGEDVQYYFAYNADSQLYLTKEIGMGRNILNVQPIWGEDTNQNKNMYSNVLYTNGTPDASSYQNGISPDRFIWLKSDAGYEMDIVFAEKYQKNGEYPITTILLNNNPYIQ